MRQGNKLGAAARTDRWAAMAIDWTLCLVASYVLAWPSYAVTVRLLGLPSILCVLVLALIPLVYLTWGWSRGGTWGMRALELQMQRPGGGRPGIPRACLRAVLVYPFGTCTVALGIATYGWFFGEYPSGATPGTSALRAVVLASGAATYAGVVALGRLDSRGRAVHDLASGVMVLGPVREVADPVDRTPVGRISAWFLLAVPPLWLVGGGFMYSIAASFLEHEAGPMLVSIVLAGAALYGSWEILRRTMTWVPGPLAIPVPARLVVRPHRISRWFLLTLLPGLLLAAPFVTATIALFVGSDFGGAAICLVPTVAILYGLWEVARRAAPLPLWAGGAHRR